MKSATKFAGPKARILTYWLLGVGLTLSYAALRGVDWRGSTELHTLMESVATVLAVVVGAMALVRFYSKQDSPILFIGVGFLGAAFLDGYHAIVTSAFFAPYLPSDLPYLISWSWIASRMFLSVMLFLSWLAWRREELLGERGRFDERTIYGGAAALTLASFLFFAFAPLPPRLLPRSAIPSSRGIRAGAIFPARPRRLSAQGRLAA